MYKILLTLGLILCFFLKQHYQNKIHSVENQRYLKFNQQELADIIAKTWKINN